MPEQMLMDLYDDSYEASEKGVANIKAVYQRLIQMNTNIAEDQENIELSIAYRDYGDERIVKVYMLKNCLYVKGIGNVDIFCELEKTNYCDLENPGMMTRGLVIGFLDKIRNMKDVLAMKSFLQTKEGKKGLTALIFIVSEAARSEIVQEAAIDILFGYSTMEYVRNCPIANWSLHELFLKNRHRIMMQYAHENCKKPITKQQIREFCFGEENSERYKQAARKLGIIPI